MLCWAYVPVNHPRPVSYTHLTSPYRKGFAETAPGIDILQKYVKAGGEKITIGSDAHQSGEIGADFGYALQLLENLPVTIGLFIRRQFVPIKMNQ